MLRIDGRERYDDEFVRKLAQLLNLVKFLFRTKTATICPPLVMGPNARNLFSAD